jgi:hypothetical protein
VKYKDESLKMEHAKDLFPWQLKRGTFNIFQKPMVISGKVVIHKPSTSTSQAML